MTDYRRVVQLILEELVAAGAVAPARCSCHGFTYECCPDRVQGGIEAGALYVTANSFLVKADIEKSGASHDH